MGLGALQRNPMQAWEHLQGRGGLPAEHSLGFLGLQTIPVLPYAG